MSSAVDQAWRAMNEPDTAKIRARAPHINKILDGSTHATKSARGTQSSPLAKQPAVPLAWVGGLESKALGCPTSAFRRLQKGIPRASLDAAGGGGTASVSKEDSLSVDEVACNLLTGWLKNKNGVADSDVCIRKAAMQNLSRDLHAVEEQFGGTPAPEQNAPLAALPGSPTSFVEDLMSILMEDLAKLLFKGLTDPAEACREAAIHAVTLLVEQVPDLTPHLAYLFPVLMARGVPAGSLYDPGLELFVHDLDEHEAYKRGRATERQDQHIPMQRVPEGSEELRLSLCRMVGRMLIGLMKRGTIGVLRPYLDDTILFLVSQCHDSYSTVKVEALAILTKMARHPQLEQGMKFYSVGLSRAFLPHLRHRHAKVRLAAVEALWMTVKVPDRAKVKGAGTAAIVDLVGFREDNVLPVAAFYGKGDTTVNYLAELTTDRSVSVRVKTTAMLGDWLTSLPDRYDHQTRLLPYVLNAIADEAKAVSAIAVETVSICGAEYELEHQDDVIERRQFGIDGDARANHAKPLPRPFSGRPRIGARLYVRGNTRRFLQPLLVELSNWICQTRLQSAMLFRTLIVYCEEHLTVETHKLIPHLQRALHLAVSAKDKLLEDVLLECCELVGRYVVPDSYLPHMLSRIREEPEINPTGNRATLLTILSKLVEGSAPKVLVLHTRDIIEVVTARCEDIAGETKPTRRATIGVLLAVANSIKSYGRLAVEEAAFAGTGRLTAIERPVQSAIAYLLACKSLGDSSFEVDECLCSLAIVCQQGSAEALITGFAGKLIENICEDYPIGPVWCRTCCPQLMLEALFSICPQAPRACPGVLPRLVLLCKNIVTELNTFEEGDQEAVLTALVGPVAHKTIGMWESSEEPTGMIQNAQNVRCVLGLSLDACWGKSSALRQSKLDILGELMESKAWHAFLYDRPAEAAATATDAMATLLEFLANPRSTPKETCRCLETISQILRTFGSVRSGMATFNLALTPFSRREVATPRTPVRNLDHDTIVADAYPTVLTRLDDSSEDVRRHALQTLGEFLPFVQPDSARTQPLSGVDGENVVASGAATSGRMGDRAVPFFSSFVLENLTYALRTASSSECTDEVDTLLRRAACLDPGAFVTVLSSVSGGSDIAGSARQLLSDLADHASILTTFQRGIEA